MIAYKRQCWLLSFLLFLVSTGCNKAPGRPDNKRSRSDANLGSEIADAQTADSYLANLRCDAPETFRGLRAWRRLSNIEVKNTAIDVFGLADVDVSSFPSDLPKKEAFDTVAVESNFINSTRLAGYEQFAKSVADRIDLGRFLPCLTEGESCLQNKLPDLLALTWRRPAVASEVQDLVSLYGLLIKDGMNAESAARSLIQAIVLSHNFLYRSELGVIQADKTFVLTDWELASVLSYTLWRRPPNAELRALAASGQLSDASRLRETVVRMLNDPAAKPAWQDFAAQWLDTARIAVTTKPNPEFTPMVKDKMVDEVRNFFASVMWGDSNKNFQTLLTADYTMADPALNFIYDASSAAGKTSFVQAERRGILGQSGFLSSHGLPDQSNPIQRGVFVAERVLCMEFPTPPPVTPPERKPGLSNKELFKQHNNPACASCHTTIDNLGFAFENFDGIGRYRSTDAGQPIVIDGSLNLDGKAVPITSPQAMFEAIGNSQQGQQCYTREVFRFSLGRPEFYWRPVVGRSAEIKLSAQGELDKCQIERATSKMREAGGDLRTAIVELMASPALRLRLKGQPETKNQ